MLAQEGVGPSALFLPCSSAFQPHPLELWVVQVHSNLNHMFWHLEKSVGCVEKPEMVTRRGEKSDQQLGTALSQGLDFSTNSIVVGARGGQPCSKMPRVKCIHFFPWQLRRQLIYTLPPISFGEKT